MAQANHVTSAHPLANDRLKDNAERTTELLEKLEETGVTSLPDRQLVELHNTLKTLEDTVKEVRKETVDSNLKDRIPEGESRFGLQHIESHRKYTPESVQTIIMRAVAMGIDYTQFVDVNASTLAKDHPEVAEIGQHEYTYLR